MDVQGTWVHPLGGGGAPIQYKFKQHQLESVGTNQHKSKRKSMYIGINAPNYIYWLKCSKSQKLYVRTYVLILAHHDVKSSCWS